MLASMFNIHSDRSVYRMTVWAVHSLLKNVIQYGQTFTVLLYVVY